MILGIDYVQQSLWPMTIQQAIVDDILGCADVASDDGRDWRLTDKCVMCTVLDVVFVMASSMTIDHGTYLYCLQLRPLCPSINPATVCVNRSWA